MTTVADVVALLERWYDPERAAPWDTVGLATGDPAAAVRAIHLAVDPTVAVALEAKAADLLITHHPLWLGGTRSVARGTRHGEVLSVLDGRALLVAHTNADVANPGVSDALGAALGLAGLRPLTPGATVGLGRVGDLPEALALSAFCACVAAALPRTVTGVRATGDPAATVRTVAVAGGSALELADLAYDIGADVLVTSDAKHHRAPGGADTRRRCRPLGRGVAVDQGPRGPVAGGAAWRGRDRVGAGDGPVDADGVGTPS